MTRIYRIKNEEMCRSVGIERELAGRADQRVLRWFGHVERIVEYLMTRKSSMTELSKRSGSEGRPRLGWMGSVEVP